VAAVKDELAAMRARRRVERMAKATVAACPHPYLVISESAGTINCGECCAPFEVHDVLDSDKPIRVIA
jgi:hypothetical protein